MIWCQIHIEAPIFSREISWEQSNNVNVYQWDYVSSNTNYGNNTKMNPQTHDYSKHFIHFPLFQIEECLYTCRNQNYLSQERDYTRRNALRAAARAWLTKPFLKCDLDSTNWLTNTKSSHRGKIRRVNSCKSKSKISQTPNISSLFPHGQGLPGVQGPSKNQSGRQHIHPFRVLSW
jgi:hypothetical protein